MLKLIKLEIKKNKLFKHWNGVLMANIGIMAFSSMIYMLEKSEGTIAFGDFDMVMGMLNAFVRSTFLIYSSVILVNLVVDEYKNKSIDIMFTYPISRKKIMTAKLLIVMIFTFLTIMLSTLFLGGLFYAVDTIMFDLFPGDIGRADVLDNLMTVFLGALASAGLSLIPLFFGMRKKSAAATIISSIFLTVLTNSTNNDFTLFSIIAVPISLGLIGVLIGYMSIRNIEDIDVH